MFLRHSRQADRFDRVIDHRAYCLAAFLISAFLIWVSSTAFAQDIPEGFQLSHYARLWQHNPFEPVSSNTAQPPSSGFEKFSLEGWSKNGNQEVVFVHNSETNEVERLTVEPNKENLRLVTIRVDQDPQLVEAVISDGRAQGRVKFRIGQNPAIVTQASTAERGGQALKSATPATAASVGETNKWGVVAADPANHQAYHRFHPGIPIVRHEGGITTP